MTRRGHKPCEENSQSGTPTLAGHDLLAVFELKYTKHAKHGLFQLVP